LLGSSEEQFLNEGCHAKLSHTMPGGAKVVMANQGSWMTPNYAAQDSKMDRASRMLRILHMRRQEKNLLEEETEVKNLFVEKIEEKESSTDEKNLFEETENARKQKNKNRTA
jgi:hypothetical protein